MRSYGLTNYRDVLIESKTASRVRAYWSNRIVMFLMGDSLARERSTVEISLLMGGKLGEVELEQ